MKLDHLLDYGAIISAESFADRGEKVIAAIHNDRLPHVRVEYVRNDIGTHLKIKMLIDDGLPDDAAGRTLDVRLYSMGSLEAFFDLVDLIRQTVKTSGSTVPAPELSLPF